MNSKTINTLYGVLSITFCYIFFLIFAQFSFLDLIRDIHGEAAINGIMAVMGLSGILFSLLSIILLNKYNGAILIKIGFFFCSLSAFFSLYSNSVLEFSFCAFLIGSGLAVLTVSLATNLTSLFNYTHIGLMTGLGTGLAYLSCNLPIIFQGNAHQRTVFSVLICAIPILFKYSVSEKRIDLDAKNIIDPKNYKSVLLMLLAFTALVWFDSSAFYIIQQSPSYKSITWNGSERLYINALVHFLSAVLAGYLLDKGVLKPLLLIAHIMLALGVLALDSTYLDPNMASVFYCIGVSVYSTALVLAPSLFLDNKFCKDAKFRSGVLYAVAGWFGSAMGIGMAQDLHIVPTTFIIISGVFLIILNSPSLIFTKNISIISALLLFLPIHTKAEETNILISKGRDVYISEGCINCHSQFVRPIGKDIEMWGPYVDYENILKGVPPLIGNRRQGPDLLNVGNRRSREWLELHLKKPRDFLPWSRMPSYEYLFKDERGNALVEYLVSLGADTIPQRLDYINSWIVNRYISPESDETTKKLYLSHCANCHGENGDGNSNLSTILNNKPRKLNTPQLAYINFNEPNAENKLARIIKFGILGTNMAGHEYFSDSEIIGLVEYIRKLSLGLSQ